MRVAVVSAQVPFIRGGAEALADGLVAALRGRGHEVELVTLPFRWYPAAGLRESMRAAESLDLSEVNGEPVDLVIALKFPAYYVRHPRKIVWLLHQHRQAYELWQTEFGDMHAWPEGTALREEIRERDRHHLGRATALFSISRTVAARLRRGNGLYATPLYPPVPAAHRLRPGPIGDFVFYPSRIDPMKRQRLLLEAAARTRSGVRVVLAGGGSRTEMEHLDELVRRHGLEQRIEMAGPMTEEDKLQAYGRCLAVYFGGHDEDYGYVPLEAMLAGKPVLLHADAGGPLEFVRHRHSGLVVESEPDALAAALDRLAGDPALAAALGEAGRREVLARVPDWAAAVEALLAPVLP